MKEARRKNPNFLKVLDTDELLIFNLEQLKLAREHTTKKLHIPIISTIIFSAISHELAVGHIESIIWHLASLAFFSIDYYYLMLYMYKSSINEYTKKELLQIAEAMEADQELNQPGAETPLIEEFDIHPGTTVDTIFNNGSDPHTNQQ